MDLGLKRKVALVAASSQGLGYAVAKELAAEGASLIICSRNQDSIDRAADKTAQAADNAVDNTRAAAAKAGRKADAAADAAARTQ